MAEIETGINVGLFIEELVNQLKTLISENALKVLYQCESAGVGDVGAWSGDAGVGAVVRGVCGGSQVCLGGPGRGSVRRRDA